MSSSAQDLTRIFFRHLFIRYEFMVPNIYLSQGYEADILGIRKSGFVDEIEIKSTRTDFLADFKKTVTVQDGEHEMKPWDKYALKKWKTMNKHEAIASGLLRPNYFSFLMPEELAVQCENDIPEYAGLYTAKLGEDWSLRERKKPARLHAGKISEQSEKRVLRKMAHRYMDTVMGRNA